MDKLGDSLEVPEPNEGLDDADDWADDDPEDLLDRKRIDLLAPDACAVASLTMAILSVLAGGLFPALNLIFDDQLRDQSGNAAWQYLVYSGPTVVVAALAIGLGLVALRRSDPAPPWSLAVAGGGVIVGAVTGFIGLVSVAIGFAIGAPDAASF